MRNVSRRILEAAGYTVLTAASGEEGLEIFEDYPDTIDLLLTDVVMPGMSGRAAAEALLKKQPDLSVLYMSGYTDNAIVHHGVLDEDTNFIQKPFSRERLVAKVREVLEA